MPAPVLTWTFLPTEVGVPQVDVRKPGLPSHSPLRAKAGGGRRVTLPLESACRAGASLFCHAPKLASRLGAAPSKLSFGDSAAPLAPGLLEMNWCGCRKLHPDIL